MDIQNTETGQERTLLKFLQQTKDGKYADIEPAALTYTRMPIQTDESYADELYYYSIS